MLGQSVVCGREAEANATLANWQDACEREGQEEAGKVIDLPEGRHQARLCWHLVMWENCQYRVGF